VSTTLTAIAILSGLGAFFGVGLAIAHRFLRVDEDPRIEVLEEKLPGSNCGACGEAGCRAFAESLIAGINAPSGCTVASPGDIDDIAAFLGVDAGAQDKRVARLHCAGGLGPARQIAEYEGFESCAAADLVGGGGKSCGWGCLGLEDCLVACDFDAIRMNDERLPVVDVDRCTACGDCVVACPRNLFEILPLAHHLIVQCAAPLAGDRAREMCRVACDACERCVQDAPGGLLRMENQLPIVDYSAGGPATSVVTQRCPTGAIQWVEGEQFVPLTASSLITSDVRT
jgi:Na+-translocating ferredoxin:NAD+ oxidoreductase RNF subunit RnfB